MSGAHGTVVPTVSWPGLARPPTTSPSPAPPVVDGRHHAGHDTMGGTSPPALNEWGIRHGRPPCVMAGPGHPRLCPLQHRQSWMAGTRPAMTQFYGNTSPEPVLASPLGRRYNHHHNHRLMRRRRRTARVQPGAYDATP